MAEKINRHMRFKNEVNYDDYQLGDLVIINHNLDREFNHSTHCPTTTKTTANDTFIINGVLLWNGYVIKEELWRQLVYPPSAHYSTIAVTLALPSNFNRRIHHGQDWFLLRVCWRLAEPRDPLHWDQRREGPGSQINLHTWAQTSIPIFQLWQMEDHDVDYLPS